MAFILGQNLPLTLTLAHCHVYFEVSMLELDHSKVIFNMESFKYINVLIIARKDLSFII